MTYLHEYSELTLTCGFFLIIFTQKLCMSTSGSKHAPRISTIIDPALPGFNDLRPAVTLTSSLGHWWGACPLREDRFMATTRESHHNNGHQFPSLFPIYCCCSCFSNSSSNFALIMKQKYLNSIPRQFTRWLSKSYIQGNFQCR